MSFDPSTLETKYGLIRINIASSSQISSLTAKVIASLEEDSEQSEKPTIVIMTAKSRVASKLISIVEIAKRELEAKGVKCFQYSAVSSQMVELPDRSKDGQKKDDARSMGATADDEISDDAFEVMGDEKPAGGTKIRALPVLTVYLAKASVKELKNAYG